MIITVALLSMSWNIFISNLTSIGCKPIVGSSNINIVLFCFLPISEASLSRCASPPDNAGVSSPSVR
ncbi:hypothetical protein [Methanosphaera sp.]